MKAILMFLAVFTAAYKSCPAQQVTVLDAETQEPIPGTVIKCTHNNKKSTITDGNGKADISDLKDCKALNFQCVGYQPKHFRATKKTIENLVILLTPSAVSLDEVVVSANKFEERKSTISSQVSVINAKAIRASLPSSTDDVLMNGGGVLIQKTQAGGGSPIIRGFEANRVLIVIDGVRMNNAIYRSGHLQNIITTDHHVLDRAEVLFGPGSVIYGSDALGGVMHLHTKAPKLSDSDQPVIDGEVFGGYGTAEDDISSGGNIAVGFKKWGIFTGFTFRKYGDLRQGSVRRAPYEDFGKRFFYAERINDEDQVIVNENPDIQRFTGYSQYDFIQKILFRPSERTAHTVNFQYSTSSDIPRYDRLTELIDDTTPKYAAWYYGPQTRLLAAYNFELKSKTLLFDNLRVVLAYQNTEESRHDRRFGENERTDKTERLHIGSVNLDLKKRLSERHMISYGTEGVYNQVKSAAEINNIISGEVMPTDTRYPDGGSDYYSVAAYLTHKWTIGEKWTVNDGIRYSFVGVSAKFIDKTFFPFPFDNADQQAGALNGNLGLIFKPGRDWRFSVLGSTGFRAPNVDDISKVFDSEPGRVVVPNPNLRPEYAYNGELTVSKTIARRINIEATAYYTLLNDAIVRSPFTFNGEDSIEFNGELSEVIANQNEEEAFIYGASATIKAEFIRRIIFTGTFNYTYGRTLTDAERVPLGHIPPIFGKASLAYTSDKFNLEVYTLYNGWKRLEDYDPGSDKPDFATADGMPAWWTLNVTTSVSIGKHLRVQAALNNLFDRNYRIFASAVSAPGRSFRTSLRVIF